MYQNESERFALHLTSRRHGTEAFKEVPYGGTEGFKEVLYSDTEGFKEVLILGISFLGLSVRKV